MDAFWLDEPYAPRAGIERAERCSIVVVGGGIVGVSAAYFLAQRKCDVVLVEQGTLGCGATGRSAGLLRTGVHLPYAVACENHGPVAARTLWKLSLENHALLRELLERETIACQYERCGSLLVAEEERELAVLQRSVAAMCEDGFRAELRSEGAFFPDDGVFHPVRFVRALGKAAEREGARLYEGTPVTSITGSTAISARGRVEAEMVLYGGGLAACTVCGTSARWTLDHATPLS